MKPRLNAVLLGVMVFVGRVGAKTNTPIIIKGLYGARPAETGGEPAGRMCSPYEKGLRFLAATQLDDGSWCSSNKVQTAAFGLVAFLDHCETTESREYGTNVFKSLKWVLAREPANGWERVCLIHSLSAAYNRMMQPACLMRLHELLANLRPEDLGKADKFMFWATRLPESIRKNPQHSTADLRSFTGSDACPVVLKFYLESSIAFHQGGNMWCDWNRNVLAERAKSQRADGSFTMEAATSPEEATIFTILAFSFNYHHFPWPTHWNIQWSPKTDASGEDEEIVIEN